MSLPPALAELVAYFEPLSTVRRDFRGAVTLHTPGVNVLALNATYLPDADQGRLPLVRAWHHAQDMPALVASAGESAGGEEVAALRVGEYHPTGTEFTGDVGVIRVEQVGRLHLPVWAATLAEAYGTPEWASALSRHLAAWLEGERDVTLLLAYAGSEEVGALLWRAMPGGGGTAHLWGTLDPAADAPLLDTAHALGGGLWASLPDHSPLGVQDETVITFSLLDGEG
ncbi:hypothetical protein DAETH_10120 [Deinococcus aetherius]|uniref:Uncharacterized protein n=1 Tax=Deinococcus aetherius TaxID=200252 RepID=A0ABM8AB94_9DEIO|nr:hypothetical protein [Deinococcus aetherius]BDP41043.1 hypothetical protein DAETH_10120 [Deinococcus aetherius]